MKFRQQRTQAQYHDEWQMLEYVFLATVIQLTSFGWKSAGYWAKVMEKSQDVQATCQQRIYTLESKWMLGWLIGNACIVSGGGRIDVTIHAMMAGRPLRIAVLFGTLILVHGKRSMYHFHFLPQSTFTPLGYLPKGLVEIEWISCWMQWDARTPIVFNNLIPLFFLFRLIFFSRLVFFRLPFYAFCFARATLLFELDNLDVRL